MTSHTVDALRYTLKKEGEAMKGWAREYRAELSEWPDVEQFVEGLAQEEAYDPEFMKELKAIETREKI